MTEPLFMCNHCGVDTRLDNLETAEDSDGPLLFCVAADECKARHAHLSADRIAAIEADRSGAREARRIH